MYDELVKELREWPRICVEYTGSIDELLDKAADAIEELSNPRWISVTERLPESGQRVLVVGLHGEAMYIGTYTGGIKETAYRKAKPYKINAGGYGWRSFTWWMPLPQPPKITAEDND